MATIKDKINACNYLINNLLEEQERIIYKNEAKIISLNTSQFDAGTGNDGKELFNTNPLYDGIYSLSTALLDSRKTAGQLYDFNNTGNFLRGLEIEVRPNLVEMDIFSTGTGSGDKSIFFTGYTNLFGLNRDNNHILQYEIILPELLIWIKKYL